MPSLTKSGNEAALQALVERGLTLVLTDQDGQPIDPGAGYEPRPLDPADWNNLEHPGVAFVFSGARSPIHGYALVPSSGLPTVYGAEVFRDGPYNIRNNGDRVVITPTLLSGT